MAAAVPILVGFALSAVSSVVMGALNRPKTQSAIYTLGEGGTVASNSLVIPMLYGEVKMAGNRLWKYVPPSKMQSYEIQCVSYGEIKGFKSVKVNDKDWWAWKDKKGRPLVSVGLYTGNGTQEITGIVQNGTSHWGRARQVGSLRKDAYAALSYTASEDLQGDIQVEYIVEGRLVRVYTTEKNYTIQYSNNPSWCVLDFMTNENGLGIPYEDLNIASFIDSARYCDDIIYDKAGKAHKRFTLNYLISDAGQALEVLNTLMLVCRGYLVYNNGLFGMFIEKAEPVSAVFDPTCANEFEIWSSPADDVYDKVSIEYIDPDYNYIKVHAPTEWLDIRRATPLHKKVPLLGVTNFFQATRLSWYYLNQSQTTQMFCKFRTDRRALLRTIGEVIELRDEPVLQFISKQWRIVAIEEDEAGSYVLSCREYNPELYNESVGAIKPTINESTLNDAFAPPKDINFLNLSQVYFLQQDKTIISYIQADYEVPELIDFKKIRFYWTTDSTTAPTPWEYISETYDVDTTKLFNPEIGKTYYVRPIIENVYGKISVGDVVGSIYITGKNFPPSKVLNFRGEETAGGIKLFWDSNSEVDITGYDIWHTSMVPNNKIATLIGGAPLFFPTDQVGIHNFYIKAIDTGSVDSEPSFTSVEIIPPPKVMSFDVWQDGRDVFFKWDKQYIDGITYEIRYGESWVLSQSIGKTDSDNLKVPWAVSMENMFWIKSISKNGVYAQKATFGRWSMAEQPNRNLVYSLNKYNNWTGNKLNTEKYAIGLILQPQRVIGDIVFPVDLPFYCTSRNWVEFRPLRISGGSDLIWQDAAFSWNDLRADSPWFDVAYHDDPVVIKNEIAIKMDEFPSHVQEYYSFDNSIIGKYGTAPVKQNAIEYADARYNTGLHISMKTNIWYDDPLSITEDFTFSCQIKVNEIPDQDGTLAILRTANDQFMRIAYDSATKAIFLERSDGKNIISDVYITQESYVFMISQSEEKCLFGIHAWGTDQTFLKEVSALPLGIFTFYSPCGTI